jgi:hypothetical protein
LAEAVAVDRGQRRHEEGKKDGRVYGAPAMQEEARGRKNSEECETEQRRRQENNRRITGG